MKMDLELADCKICSISSMCERDLKRREILYTHFNFKCIIGKCGWDHYNRCHCIFFSTTYDPSISTFYDCFLYVWFCYLRAFFLWPPGLIFLLFQIYLFKIYKADKYWCRIINNIIFEFYVTCKLSKDLIVASFAVFPSIYYDLD